ncbi:MAG: repeat-containing protein [Anaerosolibacter sp.]|jgi:tetratricopeptide (TPR) repeat protein|uniref:tetratricopeptide repeat protein n=1 Tax=Anaerosolibacter sp. TaxID=1872527 RepID=UPI00262C5B49|nr:tetratricopeptide repeat protein [Anaerosolibacter sp.]MDF2547502.1 repeat-containing protein [Anaerosolibacter sp.]
MYFLENTILPPGEKLKRLRVYLDATQQDTSNGKISRNLISYIEQGKTKLTKDTAEIIVENLKRLAQERNISVDFTAEYLMQSEIEQAEGILNRHLNNLNTLFDQEGSKFLEEFNKARGVLKDWDIAEKKAEIYEKVGDYHYKEKRFSDSYIDYLISLENYTRLSSNSSVAQLYSKLARCAIERGNYEEAVHLDNQALLIMQNNHIVDRNLMLRLLFNNALAYKKLNKYERSIELLKELESSYGDLIASRRIDVLMLKANCYLALGDSNIALEIYQKIYELSNGADNLEAKALLLINLAELHYKNNQIDKAIECLNESIKIRLKNNSVDLPNAYLILGHRLMAVQNYDAAENALTKAIFRAKELNDKKIVIEAYDGLAYCYINREKSIYLEQLIEEIKGEITADCDKYFYEIVKGIFLRIARYFMEKDLEKSMELLDFVLDKS